jgi:hypothetical protein
VWRNGLSLNKNPSDDMQGEGTGWQVEGVAVTLRHSSGAKTLIVAAPVVTAPCREPVGWASGAPSMSLAQPKFTE